MKHRLTSFALVLALLGTFAFGATRTQAASNGGGAAALIAAIVQVATDDVDVDVEVIDLDNVLNNSLNNLRALNNILNNSPILSNNNITVEDIDILDDIDVDLDLDVGDVVVAVLSNADGDLIVLSR